MIFWELFVSYLKIGFFGFGGGYAMLSLIQNEVVVQHAWMTNAEFADIVAVSQITPGPIAINSATYVGYTVGMQCGSVRYGILGSVIATFAVCLPSMTLMILVARYIARLKGNPLVSGAMRGLRPVVIGMIGAAALLLMFPQDAGDASFIDFWSWILFGGVIAGSNIQLNPNQLKDLSAATGNAKNNTKKMPPVKSTTRKEIRANAVSTMNPMCTKPHFSPPCGSLGEVRAAIRPTTGVRIRHKTNVQANPILRRLPTSPISTEIRHQVRIPSTIESVVIIS